MLRKYELMYVLRHDSSADVTQAAIDKVKDTIGAQGGTILLHESWGKKKLAYEIQKASKGIYQLTTFAADSSIIKEVERNLRIHPEVIRWLTVQLDGAVENLDALVEEYSKITPKMVPFDGEDTGYVAEDSSKSDDKKPAAKSDDDDDDDDDDKDEDEDGDDEKSDDKDEEDADKDD